MVKIENKKEEEEIESYLTRAEATLTPKFRKIFNVFFLFKQKKNFSGKEN